MSKELTSFNGLHFPLTDQQKGLFFLHQQAPHSSDYHLIIGFKLIGDLDVQRLQNSFRQTAFALPTLRTQFVSDAGLPSQKILNQRQEQWNYHDVSEMSHYATDREIRALKILESYQERPLLLEKDNLFHGILIKTGPQSHNFHIVHHHIISDGTSFKLIAQVLSQFYNGSVSGQLSFPTIQDYLDYYQSADQIKKRQAAHLYWRERLQGARFIFDFPKKCTPDLASSQERKSAFQDMVLGKELFQKFKSFCLENETTIFCGLASVLNILLYRYYQQEDLTLGYAHNIRPPSLMDLPGYYVEHFPLRSRLSGKTQSNALLQQITDTVKADRLHRSLSLTDLLEILRKENPTLTQGNFNITLVETNFYVDNLDLYNIRSEPFKTWTGRTGRDIEVSYDPSQENLPITLSFNKNVFASEFIESMQSHIKTLICSMLETPQSCISDLKLLSSHEEQQISGWNQTQCSYPQASCIHELFEQKAHQSPEAIAIIYGTEQLTYKELNHKAFTLAQKLQMLGVGPDTLVALCVTRSLDMVIGILGILKAGGAYVPLDPESPKARMIFMLNDSQVKIILTQETLTDFLKSLVVEGTTILVLDRPDTGIDEASIENEKIKLQKNVGPHHLAYMMYTSGSTGTPKGVLIEHQSVVNLLCHLEKVYPLGAKDSYLLKTNYCFDVSVPELFGYFMGKGKLIILPPSQEQDMVAMLRTIREHQVTHCNFTPSALNLFVECIDNYSDLESLKYLFSAGEALPLSTIEKIDKQPFSHNFSLENLYGPTEATVYATRCSMKHLNLPFAPIGLPTANTQIHLLDRNQQPLPIGIPGELHIAGHGLARGYHNRPELTAEKLVANPFAQHSSARMLKTGDLARRHSDGNIEYLGRLDHQIKIRGFRVECGEIENALNGHPAIAESAVVAVGHEEHLKIVAYFSLNSSEQKSWSASDLKRYLAQFLPSYMIPAEFIALANIPLTSNGKVDRQAITRKVTIVSNDTSYFAPRNEIEKKLLVLWQNLLLHKKFGIQDHFFEVGGNSLLVMKLMYQINSELNQSLKSPDVFSHPTIEQLAQFIVSRQAPRAQPESAEYNKVEGTKIQQNEKIAVIGMSCRFPGSETIEEFWKNLKDGQEGIQFFTTEELQAAGVHEAEYQDKNYVAAKGYLKDLKMFDAEFFNCTPREAQTLDPQQRLFLEEAHHALEDASYDSQGYEGKIGIYAGSGDNHYRSNIEKTLESQSGTEDYRLMINNGADFLSSRVAYKLNLKGPAIVTQTACSTSLVAIHQACQALQRGECDMALAGGVSLLGGFEKNGYFHQTGMIFSPDGHCRPFDHEAQGTILGQGVGLVVLKPLSQALADGDNIRAIVQGSAINNDGAQKVGYSAPSVQGQQQVIQEAQNNAGISADQISYVEAHGTATPLGDPIESQALLQAFGATSDPVNPSSNHCAIGSVKSNIGHTDTAAGVAGFIKTVLCLQHKTLVPTLHFKQLNPEIDWANSPFYINTQTKLWSTEKSALRYAGISAFGIGGTNAHIILKEAPIVEKACSHRRYHLVPLSAKNSEAQCQKLQQLKKYLREHPHVPVADIAFSLQIGRSSMLYKDYVVMDQQKTLLKQWEDGFQKKISSDGAPPTEAPEVIFMFPGQGSQYPNMCRDLYEEELIFRQTMDTCFAFLLQELEIDLKSILYPDSENSDLFQSQLQESQYTQIALFTVCYALAKLWQSYGIHPHAMVGHSVSEYVVACLAGVMELEDGLRLVCRRGQLVQSLPRGQMLSVGLSEKEMGVYLKNRVNIDIAALNHPQHTVISGPPQDMLDLQNQLKCEGIQHVSLPVSHAFHSAMMEPILAPFAAEVEKVNLCPPKIKYISNLTGTWITSDQATNKKYWCQHLRETVLYWQAVQTIIDNKEGNQGQQVFLEVGPGKVLSSLTKRHPKRSAEETILSSTRHPRMDGNDNYYFLEALGQLWQAGAEVNWEPCYAGEKRQRVALPGYPFAKKEHWIDHRNVEGELGKISDGGVAPKKHFRKEKQAIVGLPNVKSTIQQVWQDYLGIEAIHDEDDFFSLGGDSLVAINVIAKLQDVFCLQLSFSSMLQHSTLAGLEKLIESQLQEETKKNGAKERESSLVSIQVGKSTTEPLFMVHPAGGLLYFYRNLAQSLGQEFSVYGFQSLLNHDGGQVHEAIEDMAHGYIHDLLENFPNKSEFTLGGSSLGGIIALEMAHQLQQMGKQVRSLVIIDAPGPEHMPAPFLSTAEILLYLANEKIELPLKILEHLRAEQQIELVQKLEEESEHAAIFPPYLSVAYLETFKAQNEAMHRYRFKPFQGDAIYFRHSEWIKHFPRAMHLAWKLLIEGALEIHQVSGTHITMNHPPHVPQIALKLQTWLAKGH